MLTGHGDDRHQYNEKIRADFSSNVSFEGAHPGLFDHLRNCLPLVERYPEPDSNELCAEIARFHAVDFTQVLAFNGSVEAFYTIALTYRTAVSSILYPGFAEYGDACKMHEHELRFFTQNEWDANLNNLPDLVWLGNPNNPDGQIIEFSKIEKSIGQFPNTIFVVDEAYAGLVPFFESVIPLTRSYPNLIVVRSLTKCCAIPGLRLGYMVTTAEIATRLKKFQQPWSVNSLAQEAGKYLIRNQIENQLDARNIQKLSFNLQNAINQLADFSTIPSLAPFFLVEMQTGTSLELKQFLLHKYGILIRDASNFMGLNQRHFRICSRNEKDNELLINGLLDWIQIRLK